MFCQGDNISHNIRTLYASIYFVNKYQFSKMKVCSFKWCKKNAKSNKGTAFFQYPKCADMSRIWKEYTGYERNAKYATVCELHAWKISFVFFGVFFINKVNYFWN